VLLVAYLLRPAPLVGVASVHNMKFIEFQQQHLA
jgi:hypothetical protein